MKRVLILSLVIVFISCQKDSIVDPVEYDCNLVFADNSELHPKKESFEKAMMKVNSIVPGVQIAIRSKDGNVWLGSQGYADIANQANLEKCTKTMIGSVSKIYTSVLIMQLHNDNIISIDEMASEWLDQSVVDGIKNLDKVTIRQLLDHSSGLRDYLAAKHYVDALNTPNFKLSPREKLEYAYGKGPEGPIGEYRYSNTNYVLLGLIIEKARGMSLTEATETYISSPLGLKNTVMGTTEEPIPAGTALPYLALQSGRFTEIKDFAVYDAATGDGGIASNMQETLVFLESIFDNTLVSDSSLTLMTEENTKVEGERLLGKNIAYGLGLRILQNKYGLAIGHSGSTSAYWCEAYHFPNDNVTIAIAFNGDTENNKDYTKLQELVTELVDIAFE